MSEKHLFARFFFTAISLLCLGLQAMAQDEPDYFVYDDDDPTTIVGLKSEGVTQSELTIPASVTTVGRRAFEYHETLAISTVNNLFIKGNPVFEIEDGESALTDVKETLSLLNLGSNMSLDNIQSLLLNGYGENTGTLKKIEIEGYLHSDTEEVNWGGRNEYGEVTDDPINQTLTKETIVVLPAEIVRDQVFGLAEVHGRFALRAKLFTYCTEAKYYDIDDGSNWLFYVPTELHKEDKELFFSRVKIIKPNEGILVHNVTNSSGYVELPRVNENDTYALEHLNNSDYQRYEGLMDNIYAENMLVGVVAPTSIGETDGRYTNFILNSGQFYPTSGGTLGANRAYLQILTSDYEDMKNNSTGVNLSIVFQDKDEDAIQDVQATYRQPNQDAWFTIDGRRLSSRPTLPGIYVNGAKKVVIRVDK